MKKISFLAGLLLLLCMGGYAQTVKGRVIDDSTNTGLPNVSVVVSGTTKGTTTGTDGSFSITLPADGKKHSLQLSYSGYESLTVPVTAATGELSLRLKRSAKSLDDVVVIGYQTVKRRDVLASVSSIGSRQLRDIPLNSAEQSLAGRLAGVQVTGSEGSPDAKVLIRVRGGGSITQDNSPLYVVDGIQLDNALSTISPQDIESIDVLKDAASTSIYGARGANGVVIITTKGGRNSGGKTTITYNGFFGVNKLAKDIEVQTPYDYMYYQFERAKQTGDSSGITPYGYKWDTVLKYKNVAPYDWQKKVLGRSAFSQTHNVSVSGGTEQTQYNLSLTENYQEGIMLNSDYDRKLLAFRLDHNATSKLKIGMNVRYNYTVTNGAGTSNPGSSALNFLRQVFRYRPFIQAGQDENSFDANYYAETNANSLSLVNPVLLNNAQYRRNFNNVLDLNAYAQYTFTKWLSFRSTFGYDRNTLQRTMFDDTLTTNAKNNGANLPIAGILDSTYTTIDNANVFTLTNSGMKGWFHENNSITLIAGQETYQTHGKSTYIETRYFPVGTTASAALGNMNLGTPPNSSLTEPKPVTTDVSTTLLSFFSRLSYGYKDKYLSYVSFRADASSLFSSKNRWGYFPSATVAWRVSREDFMSKVDWINDLKIRASYGQAGNNRIAPFQYASTFTTNTQYGLNDVLITGFASPTFANPNLKWETTISRNVGIDATLFNNRLVMTVDLYSNKTRDLLVNVPIASSAGYATQIQNVGSTTNKGIEVQLGGTILQKRNFIYTANFNISFNQNKVTSLGVQKSYQANSGWAGSGNPPDYLVQVGQPVGSMYGLITDGYYKTSDFDYNPTTRVYTLKAGVVNDASATASTPMPGSLKYRDMNGDTIITAADRTIIGNAQPKFFGGLNQTISSHGFDLSVFVNFQYGNKVYNFNKLEFSSGYTPGANLMGFMKDRWHTVDQNGTVYEQLVNGAVVGASPDSLNKLNAGAKYWIPLVGSSATSFTPQSWAVEDASFIRINNITLGYTLPASVVRKIKLSRVRVYVTANNVAVITGYSGYDPEVNTRRDTPVTPGVDYSAYPRSRSFVTGLNVTF